MNSFIDEINAFINLNLSLVTHTQGLSVRIRGEENCLLAITVVLRLTKGIISNSLIKKKQSTGHVLIIHIIPEISELAAVLPLISIIQHPIIISFSNYKQPKYF